MAQTMASKKAILELGLLEGDGEGCAETLGDTEPVDGSDAHTRDAKTAHFSN
jgi:hypothetical protein